MSSSSKYFHIESAKLTVKGGNMTAALTMSTSSYELLYPGTAKEAAAADSGKYIAYQDIDSWYVFTIPVEALNKEIDCASFSSRKKMWYDRKILFDASSLPENALKGFRVPDYDRISNAVAGKSGNAPSGAASGSDAETDSGSGPETLVSPGNPSLSPLRSVGAEGRKDGEYSIGVTITGGSGRATVSTPTRLIVRGGKVCAELLWSSPYYDWMIVGGKKYTNEAEGGGNSRFTIPVGAYDRPIPVVADTTAMGDPVPIDYSITFYKSSIGDVGLIPQVAAMKVIFVAVIIIAAGFVLNVIVKKRRRYR